MILPDHMLHKWASEGGITPFDPNNINPASIDLTWSGRLRMRVGVTSFEWIDFNVEDGGSITLLPGRFYLADTFEYIAMPENAAGLLMLKSSIGRRGIEHLHAGFVDPTFYGTLTMELHVVGGPAKMKKGERIVQLMLMRMLEVPKNQYANIGRYNGQREPTPERT